LSVHRQQVCGQKLAADSAAAKQKFEVELERLDSELEETECELTKLQLLAQEVSPTIHPPPLT